MIGKTMKSPILTQTGDRKILIEAQEICLDMIRIATERYLENPTTHLEKAIKELMEEYKKTKEMYNYENIRD